MKPVASPLILFLLLAMVPLAMLLFSAPVQAEDISADKLQALKARIEALAEAQEEDLEERDSQRARLQEIETRISKLVRQRRDLEHKVVAAEKRLAKVQARQDELANQRRTQLDWLARTVRAVYERGDQPRLRLLLNQQEPGKLARLLAYQHYFQDARVKRLTVLDDQLAGLRKIARKVDAARSDLLDRRTELAAQEERLKQAADERQQVLASLDRSIDARSNSIDDLKANAKRLEQLLAEVRRSTRATGATVPADTGDTPFGRLRGELPWPVTGKIIDGFHSRRRGSLRWNGVVLAAQAGTPVRAIHAGRVVFADWMRGYGLLIIVDHGDGYLSLYGYNQALLREVGEWVATGDELALAGRSGGNTRSGLYFEIRHHGKVVNPQRWCSRNVALPPLARSGY